MTPTHFLCCKIWGFHSSEDSSWSLLACDAMQCCGRIATFWGPCHLHFTLKMEAARYPIATIRGITIQKTVTQVCMCGLVSLLKSLPLSTTNKYFKTKYWAKDCELVGTGGYYTAKNSVTYTACLVLLG